MNISFKGLLFLGLCSFFIILTPSIIFYCQGYRFDFQTRKIVQTGGLFLKISPAGVKIYINNELSKKTNFFFDKAFFSGLLPKNYIITIEKDGYHSWVKTLTVQEKQVSEAKYITLLPKDPKFTSILKNINDFFPAPDSKNLIVLKSDKNGWILNYFDSSTKKEAKITDQKALQTLVSETQQPKAKTIPEISFSNLEWSSDATRAFLTTNIKGEKKYFVIDVAPEIKLSALEFKDKIKDIANISFNPRSSQEIFFLGSVVKAPEKTTDQKSATTQNPLSSDRTMFRLQATGEPTALILPDQIAKENIIDYLILNDNILCLADSGFVYQGKINADKIEMPEILNLKPLVVNKDARYQIISKNLSKVLIKENETLYFLDNQSHLFQKIFDSVKEIKFSDDLKKIAVNNDHQIWLFYLDKEYDQPQREIQEKVFLAGYPDQIENLYWLNDYYLIFKLKNSINIAEIDNRLTLNLIEFTTFPQPKIFWQEKQKTLLALSENNLFSCDSVLK